MLKKALLILSALGALAVSGFAEGEQNFTFENDTRFTVWGLHVSPHDNTHWGPDILGRDTLSPDQNTYVYWTSDEDEAWYDIRLDFENGVHWDFTDGVNLLRASNLSVTWDGNRAHLHSQ